MSNNQITSSDRTKQIQARTVYGNFVSNQQNVNTGGAIFMNSYITNKDASFKTSLTEAQQFTTPEEQNIFLYNGTVLENRQLYTVQFTDVGSKIWTAPVTTSEITYLIVGGGGGGGGAYNNGGAGGGGGGAVITGIYGIIPGSQYTITVGDGGAGGTADHNVSPSEYRGSNGGSSSFDTVVASGGTGGYQSRVQNGNSGGGGSVTLGGNGGGGGFGGGGGGGSGGAGGNRSGITGGSRGAGTSSSLSGSAVTYGQGGAGGNSGSNNNGSASLPNTGKGGDGAGATSSSEATGRAGGSGIIILQYYA